MSIMGGTVEQSLEGAAAALFPRVERYLGRMPRGIESYPDCTVRASVFRVFAESRSLRGFPWAKAHTTIADMLRTPVPHTKWLSEVAVTSTLLAIADHHHMTDDQVVQWFRESNAALFSNRMYRSVFSLAAPSLLIRGAQGVWNSFHRGIGLGVAGRDGGADGTLTFPPFLLNEEVIRGQGEAFQIAFSMSRAKECTMQVVRITPTSASYRFDWK